MRILLSSPFRFLKPFLDRSLNFFFPQTTGKIVTEVFETQFTAMVDSFQVFLVSSRIQRKLIFHLSGRYQMPLRVCMQRCLPRHQHGSNQINQEVRPVHCWSQRTLLCPSGITLYIFSLIWASRSNEVLFQVEESGNIPDMDRIWIKGWFPILFELSCIVSRWVACSDFIL